MKCSYRIFDSVKREVGRLRRIVAPEFAEGLCGSQCKLKDGNAFFLFDNALRNVGISIAWQEGAEVKYRVFAKA